MNISQSKALQKKAHAIIPGGAHTYAKGDDQFPELAPGFIVRGKGSHVWDVDGNEFIEYAMGCRAVVLGHAYGPVIEAVARELQLGTNFSRPSPIEVDCAEELLSVLPGADMVKFAKNGSDVTSAAVRLARAYTGRELVAVCANHPFFSVDDWYIGSTSMNAGVPKAIQSLTVKFEYNDVGSLQRLLREHSGRIACVILEAEKDTPPIPGYLQEVRRLCSEQGVLFILDEMITGFRWHLGGAQAYYDVVPDLSTFGKGLGNGFSVSALAGKREFMRLGGLDHERERVFLLSYTHGAETHALAAARQVIRVYKAEPVIQSLWENGSRLQQGIQKTVAELRLGDHFMLLGKPCNMVFSALDGEKKPSQPFRTLFLQETIRRGILALSFVISYSHNASDITRTIEAVSEALLVYRKALDEGIEKYLVGRPVKPVFRRLN